MKIRTITLGLSGSPTIPLVEWASAQLERATNHFLSRGVEVQTRRIALGHWDSGLGRMSWMEREELLLLIDSICGALNIDMCSVGMVREPSHIEHAVSIIANAARLSASAEGGSLHRGINIEALDAAAEGICYLASNTKQSFGNFFWGTGFCLGPAAPFFPGSYHVQDQPIFVIGLENSDLLVEAFKISKSPQRLPNVLYDVLLRAFKAIEDEAYRLSELIDVQFGGLDTSIVPSLLADESIVKAFRAIDVEFGSAGTLAACGAVTTVVKKLPLKQVGYCGIMLPVLEDAGLAQATEEDRFTISDLLAYSSVCGVGIDMVPLAGNVEPNQLKNLLLDVGTMALKLRKPLSVRVLPIFGKSVGDVTEFNSPYLCNAQILSL